ncbi:DUF4180 domain-containing protein [Kitasatospora sp. NBC_01287]|uniref:DUF4180 domain-containing protein n=1 Tax=Kitasatospora sp. NBC_01287 TaxID=2903573 RepID=UPI00225839EE|nr:DUF4180 domain-containing protein [Kitasatospora sp. NBC_01287]MCX4745256.1 DUF4180 domain-containing protein [Kitasatospora sp. NBC_01287]
MTIELLHETPVLVCAPDGDPLSSVADALGLIGEAGYGEASWVAVPVQRWPEEFFRLRSGLAGEVLQKFAQYRVNLAVVGDISRWTEESSALRDFVRECDRGRQCWFVADLAELGERLGERLGDQPNGS